MHIEYIYSNHATGKLGIEYVFYRVLHVPSGVARVLVVLQLRPFTAGQARIRKEPLGSLLIGILDELAVQPLGYEHGRLGSAGVQHRKGLIAKLAQLRPGRDGGWRAVRKELRALRKRRGLGREQRRTVELRRPRPGKIRKSNASKRQGQGSRQAHTAWPKEQTIHRRDEKVEQKRSPIGALFSFTPRPECSDPAGFYSCLQVGSSKTKRAPQREPDLPARPCGSVNTPHGSSTRKCKVPPPWEVPQLLQSNSSSWSTNYMALNSPWGIWPVRRASAAWARTAARSAVDL